MNLKQFKLTNGEEILCEVVEWPDETHSEILVRNVIEIVTKEISTEADPGYGRYYILRPWMMYVDGYKEIVMISPTSVAGTVGVVDTDTSEQYHYGVAKMQDLHDNRIQASADRESALLSDLLSTVVPSGSTKTLTDSAGTNVIVFPSGSDKVH